MTPNEAAEIIEVIVTADGGCYTCIHNLYVGLQEKLASVDWVYAVKLAKITDRERDILLNWDDT